ncbi:hypothetical protein [Aliiruegeria lutimaris]|uniref:Uncharacterized protein n=1 Tax=Aliiruegeria lutimaris TaxID=571298 RepID=A0A1G8MYF8_9RHOB|nr:hypothetical protein [Aliiruegeria lutimaris]SDI72934.1 hypothetical protein SAMN04488026_100690 [Aliiruegeria lutimaris]
MSEFLPRELRDEMERARRTQRRKRTYMKVRAGEQEMPILRYWESGFAVTAEDAPRLRGLVDQFDHGKHLCQALIVTSSETDGERIYEVKTANPAGRSAPAVDFVRERPETVGLLSND